MLGGRWGGKEIKKVLCTPHRNAYYVEVELEKNID